MLNRDLISKYITPLSPLPTSLNQSGNLKENIKCLLFDIYGTLFISGSGDISIAKENLTETEKLDQLLAKFKISKNSGAILKDFFACIEKKHEELKENGTDFPEVEIDRIWMNVLKNNNINTVRMFALLFELIVNPVYPMPNLKKMLSVCKEKKMPTGIISNAQFYTPYLFNWFLGLDLEKLGFYSDLVIFSYRFGCAKPSMSLFQIAVEKLKNMNIPASSALYIGNDMLKDIYPAKKAGFKTALFAGDARSLRLRRDDLRCKNLSPDLVITDLIQLLDYIMD